MAVRQDCKSFQNISSIHDYLSFSLVVWDTARFAIKPVPNIDWVSIANATPIHSAESVIKLRYANWFSQS